MKAIIGKPNLGCALEGAWRTQVIERRRLREIRKREVERVSAANVFRARHGVDFDGSASHFMALAPVTRALVERELIRDIQEHPHEWETSPIAEVVDERAASNLILDQGLNQSLNGTAEFGNLTRYCARGTGSTAPANGDTGLVAEVGPRTNTYLTGAGNCGTTYASAAFTLRRTYDFPVEVSNQNYAELGWSYSSSVAANLFARSLVDGGTVSVLIGQQLRVIHDLTNNCSPTTTQADTLTIAGWASTGGNWQWGGLGIDVVDTNGANSSAVGNAFDASNTGGRLFKLFSAAATLNSWRTNATLNGSEIYSAIGGSWAAYVAGSFTRTFSFPYIPAISGNSTSIRCYAISGNTVTYELAFNFTNAQTKDSLHQLKMPGYSLTVARV